MEMLAMVYMFGLLVLLKFGLDQVVERPADTEYSPTESPLWTKTPSFLDCVAHAAYDKDDCVLAYTFNKGPDYEVGDALIHSVADILERTAGVRPSLKAFDNEGLLETYYLIHPRTIWAAITFAHGAQLGAATIQYNIRINNSYVLLANMPYVGWSEDVYISSGFLTLQNAVDKALSYSLRPNDDIAIPDRVVVQKFPTPERSFRVGGFLDVVKATYFALAFVPTLQWFIVHLVAEKESKLKEGMLVMGLLDTVFWSSWVLTQVFSSGLIATMVAFLCWAVGLFSGSNFVVVLLLFWLYLASLITFGCLVSVFFHRAKLAGSVGASFVAVACGIGGLISGMASSPAIAFLSSFISPVPFTFAAIKILRGEAQLDSLFSSTYSIFFSVVMLAIDTCFYAFMAWYLHNVLPGEYGSTKHIFFCFTPSYWRGNQGDTPDSVSLAPLESYNEDDFELSLEDDGISTFEGVGAEADKPVALQFINLRKVYARSLRLPKRLRTGTTYQKLESKLDDVVAVDNVNLTVYKGQILALLGKRGSGKSTIAAMLSGLFPPTSGIAYVNGHCTATQMHLVRRSLGVCPQNDILFEPMTPEEHLTLFAGLKGVPPLQVSLVVTQHLEQLGLTAIADQPVSSLSSGQRRKVSVASALIGNPEVIFLDEPTAGLDPVSRRQIWDLLLEYKKTKTVVITTHSMEEAELLGDRIGIMLDGQLKCLGTPPFLKNRFGAGYRLTVNKHHEGAAAASSEDEDFYIDRREHSAITNLVVSFVGGDPLSLIEGNPTKHEIHYKLPTEAVPQFPSLLASLESEKENLGVSGFSITMMSLEEVFLKMAEDGSDLLTRRGPVAAAPEFEETSVDKPSTSRAHAARNVSSFQPDPAFVSQMKALTSSKIRSTFRVKKSLACAVLYPIIILLVGIMVVRYGLSSSSFPPTTVMRPGNWRNADGSFLNTVPFVNETDHEIIALKKFRFDVHFTPNDTEAQLSQYLLQTDNQHVGAYVFRPNGVDYLLLYNETLQHASSLMLNEINNGLINAYTTPSSTQHWVEAQSHPLPYSSGQSETTPLVLVAVLVMAFVALPAFSCESIVRERCAKLKHQLIVMGLKPRVYWWSQFVADLVFLYPIVFIALFLGFAFGLSVFKDPYITQTTLLFVCYPVSVLPFTYLVSMTVASSEGVTRYVGSFFVFGTIVPLMLVSGMRLMYPYTADLVNFFFSLFPPYAFASGLFLVASRTMSIGAFASAPGSLDAEIEVFNQVLMQLATSFFYLSLLVTFQNVSGSLRCCTGPAWKTAADPLDDDMNEDASVDEDEDVAQERIDVLEALHSSSLDGASNNERLVVNSSLLVSGLRKEYVGPPEGVTTTAVFDLAIGIPRGECFGLLGPTGSGKSTTLGMLNGDVIPTSGHAVVMGLDLRAKYADAYKHMGVCQQNNTLWPALTPREHLILFTSLRGVPKAERAAVAEEMMDELDLADVADVQVRSLTGATLRKLCVAVAMIGNPTILYMDEPTTGMDARNKRLVWDALLRRKKNHICVLTTQSMEEAEALCSRIGIMANGRLHCVGSPQHLRARFGGGYYLEINASEENSRQVDQVVHGVAPNARLAHDFHGRMCFEIRDHFDLSAMFAALTNLRYASTIDDFSLSQTTMTHVYLRFASQQLAPATHDDEE